MFELISIKNDQIKKILELIEFSNNKQINIEKVFNFFEQIDNNLLKE